MRRMLSGSRQKIDRCIQKFCSKLQEIYPASCLQDYYRNTYSLESVAGLLRDSAPPELVNKYINVGFSNQRYGFLREIQNKLDMVADSFQRIVLYIKDHLKAILKGLENSPKSPNDLTYRFEESKMKPKIEMGVIKSKFIASSKIECANGKIFFPKLDNIVSFLPWIYSDKGFTTGTHELRLTSHRFPSIPNSGVAVIAEHDLDTYPYHYFKSLFTKDSKGFVLAKPTESQLEVQKDPPRAYYNEIQNVIGSTAEVILRLELTANPRAILCNADRTSVYVCKLDPQKKYRLAVYGSGWTVSIEQLW